MNLSLLSRTKLICPFYHLVSDEVESYVNKLYRPKSIDNFINELEYLHSIAKPLTIKEIQDGAWKNKAGLFYHLSFDDGFKILMNTVVPFLEKKQIPATFFINSAFVGDRDYMYRLKVNLMMNYLEALAPSKQSDIINRLGFSNLDECIEHLKHADWNDKNEIQTSFNLCIEHGMSLPKEVYMTKEDILQLKEKGFFVGAHSVDHPLFSKLSFQEQKAQIEDSFHFLEKLGISERIFSFPFHELGVRKEEMDWISNTVDVSFGSQYLNRTGYVNHFSRINMEDLSGRPPKIFNQLFLKSFAKRLLGRDRILWK